MLMMKKGEEKEATHEGKRVNFSYSSFQILDNLFPCTIITPLDCFWEGSKLLGPDRPVHIP